MASVAELRQILKEDTAGKNLYDHLTETLMKLLIDKPTNAYDQVTFKHLLKQNIIYNEMIIIFYYKQHHDYI